MSENNFTHPIEVRYGDLDPQGHLNNSKYLTYFETARTHYFIQLELFKERTSFLDIGVILADIHLSFHAPVMFGDDIVVSVRTTHLGNKSFKVQQSLINRSNGIEVCTGEVVLVSYDYHTGKTIPIPMEWREKITQFENLA